MDRKIDALLRSRYFSLGLAALNLFFAINAAVNSSIFLFCLCSIFGAICFKNYLNG